MPDRVCEGVDPGHVEDGGELARVGDGAAVLDVGGGADRIPLGRVEAGKCRAQPGAVARDMGNHPRVRHGEPLLGEPAESAGLAVEIRRQVGIVERNQTEL